MEQKTQGSSDPSMPNGQAGQEQILANKTATIKPSTPNEELETANLLSEEVSLKPETNNMEVHHHPDVEKKGFKEYFFEFIMIFLAVTMGFFAENIRENISDGKRTNEYMKSLVSDLQSDLVMYDSCQKFNLAYCSMIDSIITSLKEKKDNLALVYYMARKVTMGSSIVAPDTKTFEQMKSGGGFRLIRKQSTADAIGSYYQLTKKFDYWSDLQRQRINDIINNNDKIFDASILYFVLKNIETKTKEEIVAAIKNPSLISSEPVAVNSVIIHYQYYYGMLRLNYQRAEAGASQAKQLIEIIQKEYDLQND